MSERFEDWLPNTTRFLIYGNRGYFWLDFNEQGVPSVPGSQKAWAAFRAYGPPDQVAEAYRQLNGWLDDLAARNTGPYASARFGREVRDAWVARKKLARQRAEGEKE